MSNFEHGSLLEYLELTPKDEAELHQLKIRLHEIMGEDKKARGKIVKTYQDIADELKDLDRHKLVFMIFVCTNFEQIAYSILVDICGQETADKILTARITGSATGGNTDNNGGS